MTASTASRGSAPRVWPRFSAVSAWPDVDTRGASSEGHGWPGRYRIRVRVSPEARSAYEELAAGDAVAVGTVVAAFHEHEDGSAGPVFVMQKAETGWIYLELDASGVPLGGDTNHCARCHAEARSDSLFGRALLGTPAPSGSAQTPGVADPPESRGATADP